MVNKNNKSDKVKKYRVTYYSRYYKFDINRGYVKGTSKSDIRNRWHEIMETDEYVIKSLEEVKD